MIETQRLLLRPFCESDASDVLEYLGEPTMHCFADLRLSSLEDAKAKMRRRSEDPELYFAIELKESGKVIGEIYAYSETDLSGVEQQSDTFSPSWMLNSSYQGKGYAYEAARAFVDYLFEQMGARRLYAYVEDYNIPSRHLCEKLGMREEGLFREFISFVNDQDGNPIYENAMQYAILKKEWEAHKAE